MHLSRDMDGQQEVLLDAVHSLLPSTIGNDDDDDDATIRENVTCRCCHSSINEPFILKIGLDSYHEQCVQCSVCSAPLTDRCFERDGQIYCRLHYYRLYSAYRCPGCNHGISPSDIVYKLKTGIIYHVACHLCIYCGRQLTPGEQIVVDDTTKSIACIQHYTLASLSPSTMVESDSGTTAVQLDFITNYASTSNNNEIVTTRIGLTELSSSNHMCDSPVGYGSFADAYAAFGCVADDSKYMKRRGPRTTIKQDQLDVLNQIFSSTPKPSKHARAKLALETGLSMRVIQVWFQNRRSKERRLKHLCNYLRHFESRGLQPPHLADGQSPFGQLGTVDSLLLPSDFVSTSGDDYHNCTFDSPPGQMSADDDDGDELSS